LLAGLNANENIASYDLNNKRNIFDPDIHFVGTWDCEHASRNRVRTAYFAGRYLVDEAVDVTSVNYSNPHTHDLNDNSHDTITVKNSLDANDRRFNKVSSTRLFTEFSL
jgi:hypothetical protein